MNKIVAALLLVTFTSPLLSHPVAAANRCFAPDQVKAEKLLRLHSELMVVTVSCKRSSTGRDLVKAYTGFTKRNVNAIRQAETTLIDYYAQTYGGNGITKLDDLRTKLANEYSQVMADESAPAFCAKRGDMVVAMYDSPPASIQDTSMLSYASALSYEPVCDKSLKVAHVADTLENEPVLASKGGEMKQKKIKKKDKS